MDAPPPLLGVAAGPSPPQARPAATPLTAAPTAPITAPPWPRSAQAATAVFLLLALGLLGWHAWTAQRWGARPTEFDPGAVAGRIDLNRADRAQLLQLPGVGDITAGRIEEYRVSHNGFRTVEELRQVRGIGPALLERLRPFVEVQPYEGGEDESDGGPPAEVRKDVPPKAVKSAARKPFATAGKKGENLTEPIDVNRASAEELQRLPGVGPTLSGRILFVRERQPFQSINELRRVPGIGPKTLEHLRPFVVVNDQQAPP